MEGTARPSRRSLEPGPAGTLPGRAGTLPGPAPGSSGVVARDAELARVAALLDAATGRPVALVLAGEAGAGKSTILRWGVDEAGRRGFRVLLARPAEAEAQLAFAGLADLFEGVGVDVLGGLPDPQRHGLEAALRRVEGGPEVDRLSISQAVLGALRAMAAVGPVVVAIDDAQWLDAPTVRVLEFALRRVDGDAVAVLAAVRAPDAAAAVETTLLRAVPRDRVEALAIGPLGVEAVGRLVGDRLGRVPGRAVAARIRELSGGNPFYALELGRAWLDAAGRSTPGAGAVAGSGRPATGAPAPEATAARSSAPDTTEPDVVDASVPVPDSMAALVRDRLAKLGGPAREAALVVAAAMQPTREVVEAAIGEPGAQAGLREAIELGVLEEDAAGRLAFSHPLLAWTALTSAGPERRRAVHARLADVVGDPDQAVRHRSLVTTPPDEGVAAELDAAARRAHDRGAPETAAQLAAAALRLTDPGDAARIRRRTLGAAELLIQAGDPPPARALLEAYVAATPPGPDRAGPLQLLADIRSGDDWEAKLELLRQARDEAEPGSRDHAEIEVAIGVAHWALLRDLRAGIDHARRGLAEAERVGDPAVVVRALSSVVFLEAFAGELEGTMERLARGIALEPRAPEVRLLFRPSYFRGLLLDWSDRLVEARLAHRELLAEVERIGDSDTRPLVLLDLGAVELRLGNWAEAARLQAEAEVASDLLGHPSSRAMASAVRAHAEAIRGNVVAVREAAALAIELARRTSSLVNEGNARLALAIAELAAGDPRAALDAVRPTVDRLADAGIGHTPALPAVAVAAEAAAELGDRPTLDPLLARLHAYGTRTGHPSTLRAAFRAAAIIAATEGDLEAAIEASSASLAHAARVAEPFQAARGQLLHAEILRRLRRRAAAREAAGAALAAFEAVGSETWADRARSELARAGQATGGNGDPALTPTQRQVAALVVAGRTNREVAAALFMSPHTVEAHLTSIYRVLGIRTRTDLARVLAADGHAERGIDEGHG